MKAETKAKRRVTLAICGLSMLDESELDGVRSKIDKPAAQSRTLDDVAGDTSSSEISALMVDLERCVTKATLVDWARALLSITAHKEAKQAAWFAWAAQCETMELVPAELAKEARAK
jgi:hypothetical protein